jgi:hypothetical protein
VHPQPPRGLEIDDVHDPLDPAAEEAAEAAHPAPTPNDPLDQAPDLADAADPVRRRTRPALSSTPTSFETAASEMSNWAATSLTRASPRGIAHGRLNIHRRGGVVKPSPTD